MTLAVRLHARRPPLIRCPSQPWRALYLRSTCSICEVKKPVATEKQRKRCLYDTAGGSFENLIFERYPLGSFSSNHVSAASWLAKTFR
jgi:hypothetical protein